MISPRFHVHLQLVVFFLVLSRTWSVTAEIDSSFDGWISWHLNNYKHKKSSLGLDKTTLEMKTMREIRVSQDGSGDYTTISEAINTIPLHNNAMVVLRINSGVYSEKVRIPKTMRYITIVGNASDPPTITGNDTASTPRGRDGKLLRTFDSATVAVDGDFFTAINFKFENTAPHVVGSKVGQAVALRISGTKAAFYNCSFYGTQDTLYDHKGLHYFSNCFIQGSVDFIFGYATSLYENCYLNSVTQKVASITAQKRSDPSMSSGFSFKNCTVAGSGSIYLGRAWGDYSRVVFSYTFMDKLVLPQGWSDWGKTSSHQKVYYGEYKCSGPGANLTGRVGWARSLTDEEAMPFLGTYYIDGSTWLVDPSIYNL